MGGRVRIRAWVEMWDERRPFSRLASSLSLGSQICIGGSDPPSEAPMPAGGSICWLRVMERQTPTCRLWVRVRGSDARPGA